MSRQEDVRLFLESGKIAPLNWIAGDHARLFAGALSEVLRRLPDEVFDDVVEPNVDFVVDMGGFEALNAPRAWVIPTGGASYLTIRRDTIILLQPCWQYSQRALIGLIAHEIAHSVREENEHFENEAAADSLVREWGFVEEMDAFESERNPSSEGG